MKNSTLIAIAMLASGCPNAPNALSRGELAEQRIGLARCEALCAVTSGPGWTDPTHERCTDLFADANRSRARAVDSGRIRIDEAALDACTAAVGCVAQAPGSPAVSPSDPALRCRAAFVGTVARGATCRVSEECSDGNHCQISGAGCGTCIAEVAIGGTCAVDDECVGLDSVCSRRRCVRAASEALANEGAPCGLLDSISDVNRYANCAPGLVCGGAPMRCIRPLGDGAPCNLTENACESGFTCAGLETRSCTRTTVAPEGAPCGTSPDGMLPRCEATGGLECLGRMCRRPPPIGQECEGFCAIGAFCQGGRCAARQAAGGMCASGNECESGTCVASRCADLVCSG